MKTKKIALTFGLAITLLSSLILSIWRISYMKKYYDPYKLEYDFEADKILSSLGWTLFAIIIILAAISFYTRKLRPKELPSSATQFSVFANAFCGIVFIIAAALTIIYSPKLPINTSGKVSSLFVIALALSVILMVICGFYFIVNASVRLNSRGYKKYLSVALPVWAIMFLFTSYFNKDFIYSDPNRILANMTVISFMLLLLLESRSAIGRRQNSLRYFLSLTTVLLTTVYFLPTALLTAFWEMTPTLIFYLEICEVGIFFYALSVSANYIISANKSVD